MCLHSVSSGFRLQDEGFVFVAYSVNQSVYPQIENKGKIPKIMPHLGYNLGATGWVVWMFLVLIQHFSFFDWVRENTLFYLSGISTFTPKISALALKTYWGQNLAELAAVESNMLFSRAERGKGELCKGGGVEFGRCYVAVWCRGSREAWQRGACSHPPVFLLLLEKGEGTSAKERKASWMERQ